MLEHFQWKSKEEMNQYVVDHKAEIGEELADVLYCILLMSHDLNIDVAEAVEKKMVKNAEKYPVEKFRGSNAKYNKL